MKPTSPKSDQNRAAFTMVELLIVISVIAIMASLVISAFSNAAQDTRRVVARQQQAAVQAAVNAWVSSNSSGVGQSLSSARTAYNAAADGLARLNLVGGYLDEQTLAHFTSNTTNNNQILSSALKKTGQYLELAAWADGSYPKVELK